MAVIVGPPDSVYHGGIFYILIETPQDYPFRPPRLRALNKIFHPQIEDDGGICLDETSQTFSPALMVHNIISKLCECLKVPNTYCYVHGKASEVFLLRKHEIQEISLNYVEKFA